MANPLVSAAQLARMLFTSKSLRLQTHLFLMAVPLNLIWEIGQMSAYDFPESSLFMDLIGCFVLSLGDGLMTLIIYWAGWLGFRDSQWILHPGIRGYLFMMSIGLVLAVTVEWNALHRTGAWAYNERMITIPILGVVFCLYCRCSCCRLRPSFFSNGFGEIGRMIYRTDKRCDET